MDEVLLHRFLAEGPAARLRLAAKLRSDQKLSFIERHFLEHATITWEEPKRRGRSTKAWDWGAIHNEVMDLRNQGEKAKAAYEIVANKRKLSASTIEKVFRAENPRKK